MTERLVVVGGDAAGLAAAARARKRRLPDDLEIVAFERGEHSSYSACGIPYYVGGLIPDVRALTTRPPERFREKFAIEIRTGHEVVAIDAAERRVTVRGPAGEHERVAFDHLVIATGATPMRPALPGIDTPGIFGVQGLGDGIAIRRVIEERAPASAVVVGGGYIGLEMAEALVGRGIATTLVEAAPQPMNTLDPDMGALVADAMRARDIDLLLSEPVTSFEAEGDWVGAVRTGQRTIPADIVILGLGVRPNADLALRSGIPVGVTGGIVTDDRMATAIPGVWAAGDCVETVHRLTGKPVAIALGTHARKQGRVAGVNIGGGSLRFPGVIGTAATKVCDVEVARTGLGEREAADAGFDAVAFTADSTTRADYYPGTESIRIKVIVEREARRLLGAQIVGAEGSAKRIDVLATAIWNGMSVDDVHQMDLAYAPPFAPTWDPVLIAARRAAERL